MSVSFGCFDAPRETHPCEWCAKERTRKDGGALDGQWIADPSTLTDDEWARVTCDPWCRGEHEESVAPEVNLANVSARGVLALLGLDAHDLCGRLAPEEIPAVMQRLLIVTHRADERAHLERDAFDGRAFDTPRVVTDPDTGLDTISRGCRVIDCGNTDEQTMRRLNSMRALLAYAQEHGCEVTWG